MGISPRVHFFDKYGKIEKIPYRKFERLLNADKDVFYPKYSSERVKCSISYVEMENRQAINIIHCDYLIITFNENGQLDTNKHAQGTALMFQSIDLLGNLNNITYLQPVIAQKQYRQDFIWQANQQEINAIVKQIFSKK
ncbi:hypothetical protein [Colwellia sp. 12G3]|uniref:hypothetical protein n=1 Tax=Colwellia sp. 12G3 TaxID=2058299 RepID=UPI000C340ECC|nr:hypothetical protein [Colwellia sp. 12G3]PKI14338.1 hypothetical protein CXF71_17425 [Colwellia sp. 12G3]